jgi:hypothetical protein
MKNMLLRRILISFDSPDSFVLICSKHPVDFPLHYRTVGLSVSMALRATEIQGLQFSALMSHIYMNTVGRLGRLI